MPRGRRKDPHREAPGGINYPAGESRKSLPKEPIKPSGFLCFGFNEGAKARARGGGSGARAEESHYRASINGAVSRGIRD